MTSACATALRHPGRRDGEDGQLGEACVTSVLHFGGSFHVLVVDEYG